MESPNPVRSCHVLFKYINKSGYLALGEHLYVYDATGNTVIYMVTHLIMYKIPISKNTLRATINLKKKKNVERDKCRQQNDNDKRFHFRTRHLPVFVKKNNNNASINRDHD